MWLDQPRPAPFGTSAVIVVSFGALWAAYHIYWSLRLVRAGASWESAVVIAPFLLAGVWMQTYPLRLARRARRTVYVVTDPRAMIVQARRRCTHVRFFEPWQLRAVQKRRRPDGSGDLIFDGTAGDSSEDAQGSFPGDDGFHNVPDVNETEQFIRALAAIS
jgi:hypothetical protein